MHIDPEALLVLKKMQQLAPAYLVGGYLRDKAIGIPPHDIDIAVETDLASVQTLFPRLSFTEKGAERGVARFSHNNRLYDISTYPANGFRQTLSKRDFVCNSLYHDGSSLFDPFCALSDIAGKVISPLESPFLHFKNRPVAYLRAIRLSAQTNFSIHPELIEFLFQHPHLFKEINENRIQQEGYRILSSAFPLQAFHYLSNLNFILPCNPLQVDTNIPPLTAPVHIRFTFIAGLVGEPAFYSYCDVFSLGKKIKEKVSFLFPYLAEDLIPDHPAMLNQVLLLKKLQYHKEPEKLKTFFLRVKDRHM